MQALRQPPWEHSRKWPLQAKQVQMRHDRELSDAICILQYVTKTTHCVADNVQYIEVAWFQIFHASPACLARIKESVCPFRFLALSVLLLTVYTANFKKVGPLAPRAVPFDDGISGICGKGIGMSSLSSVARGLKLIKLPLLVANGGTLQSRVHHVQYGRTIAWLRGVPYIFMVGSAGSGWGPSNLFCWVQDWRPCELQLR